jgi:protein TonB
MRRNLNGSVDLGFTVATDGTVYNVEILDSTPGTVFDQVAIDAVSEWRFEPPIENGSPVEKVTAVRMAFNLE